MAKQRRRKHPDRVPGQGRAAAPSSPAPDHAARGTRIKVAAGVGMVVAVIVVVAFSGPLRQSSDDPTASGTTGVPEGAGGKVAPIPTVPPDLGPAITDPPVDPSVLAGLHFTDVTEGSGLGLVQADRPVYQDDSFVGGASVVDFDDDGRPDVFLPRLGLPAVLLRNQGDGTFADVTEAAGLQGPDPAKGSSVGTWGDVDGDGDQDLWLTSADGAPNRLYRNEGDGTFADVTEDAGLATEPAADRIDAMYGAAFADVDRDGDLDLLSLHYNVAVLDQREQYDTDLEGVGLCEAAPSRRFDQGPVVEQSQSRLYVNDGEGRFEDRAEELGLPLHQVVGFTPTFADYDLDGWPDLFLAGDFCTSRVFRNDEGRGFTEVTEELGVDTAQNAMGSAIEDLDGDGRPDWFVTSISYPPGAAEGGECVTEVRGNTGCTGNRLWLNRPGGRWEDATDRFGVREGKWGWGAQLQDLDNDGDRDVLMVNGYRYSYDRPPEGNAERPYWDHFLEDQPRLWLNTGGVAPGGAAFPQVAVPAGLDSGGLGKSAITFDHDGDGDLDLLVSRTESTPILYRNDLPPTNAWLTVALDDERSGNAHGLGARIVVEPGDGAPAQSAEIRSAGTYGGSTVPWAHFGFGPGTTTLDRVEVHWPDGEVTVETDVPVDRFHEITRS